MHLGGVVMRRQVLEARHYVRELVQIEDARALVINMEQCLPVLMAEDWLWMADDRSAGNNDMPMAIVVSPPYEKRLRAYCRLMAERGYVRGPFIGLPAAIVWASKCQEHWPSRPLALPELRPPPHWQSPRRERSVNMPVS